ncbi:MAG: aspartyl/asparaginyl beta-hydroxylase domain-containing protein [Hyphomonadaceae bacterium]
MRLAHPFVQLPIRFDAEVLAREIKALGEAPWRPHPQGFPGNSMLPLIAVNGDPVNETFAGRMGPTPHLQRCPYLTQTMAALGVTLGRSRLMRLSGRAEVTEHADQGYYWIERMRVHVPIVTQPSVRFLCGGAEVNMAAGECWIFDTWRQHNVLNENDDERIHLVVDTVGGERFFNYVAAGRPHPPTPQQTPGWSAALIPPSAETPQLDLETVNVPVVMSPWEISAHLGMLFYDARGHANLPALQRSAAQFQRQWRSLWARYGEGAEGWPHYRRAVDSFIAVARPAAEPIDLPNGVPLYSALRAMIGEVAAPKAGAATAGAQRATAMADRA